MHNQKQLMYGTIRSYYSLWSYQIENVNSKMYDEQLNLTSSAIKNTFFSSN